MRLASGVTGPAGFWEDSKCEGPRKLAGRTAGSPPRADPELLQAVVKERTLAGSREGVFSSTRWNLESFQKALLGFWVPPLDSDLIGVGYGLGTYFKAL